MIKGQLADQAQQLVGEGVPFVLATVVGARRPTSVRPGDCALVLPDGTIEGFVGGVCAESTVLLYSLRALETGEPVLLRLVPGDPGDGPGDGGADPVRGAVVEHNPCLSGGALEIFLDPQLPAARLVVIGSAPIAAAVAALGAAAGFDVIRATGDEFHPDERDGAVIVASHGSDEERVLSEALLTGVPYVALVASVKRGSAVRAALDVPDELRARLHTPAGLDIGARTPEEVAVSILAQMVAERHAHPANALAGRAPTGTGVDPVCGMTVAITDATPYLDRGGERLYFCGEHCREAYAAEHAEHRAAG